MQRPCSPMACAALSLKRYSSSPGQLFVQMISTIGSNCCGAVTIALTNLAKTCPMQYHPTFLEAMMSSTYTDFVNALDYLVSIEPDPESFVHMEEYDAIEPPAQQDRKSTRLNSSH